MTLEQALERIRQLEHALQTLESFRPPPQPSNREVAEAQTRMAAAEQRARALESELHGWRNRSARKELARAERRIRDKHKTQFQIVGSRADIVIFDDLGAP